MSFNPLALPGSYSDLYAHYGNPHHADFAHLWIVETTFCNHRVQCHKVIAPLLKSIEKITHVRDHVNTVDGCYVVRAIRGGANPSLHSWGLAIDINAHQFPLGSSNRQNHDLTVAFQSQCFFYGGDFYHRKDPMHYQWTKPHTI